MYKILQINEDGFKQIIDVLQELKESIAIQNSKLEPKWMTGEEVLTYLNIGLRTLQNYRDKGLIGFTQICKKKILYKRLDVEELLNNNYNKSFKNKNYAK